MNRPELEALQRWLALEHEAVWLYGRIGARNDALATAARSAFDAHRTSRDELLAAITRAGGTPTGAQLTYGEDLSASATAARSAAATVEERICAACLVVVGVAGPDGRRTAVDGLRRAALAALAWDAPPRAFPGLA